MGNCQAVEAAAAAVIEHPGDKTERIYWSVSANEIMGLNPGHYVALVITSPTLKNDNGSPLRQLKLLRPDDALLLGQVYRLVSFEDVLKEFAAKKCVKLGKLPKDRGGPPGMELNKRNDSGCPDPCPNPNSISENCNSLQVEEEVVREGSNGGGSRYMTRHQWRPALQSIAEVGT